MPAKLLAAYTMNEISTVRITPLTANATSISMNVKADLECERGLIHIRLHSISRHVSTHRAGPVGVAHRSPVNTHRDLAHRVGVTRGRAVTFGHTTGFQDAPPGIDQ